LIRWRFVSHLTLPYVVRSKCVHLDRPNDDQLGPNIIVSSEFPFRAPDAVTTIREYDHSTGSLVRVFAPPSGIGFHQPRGLRFGPDRHLDCAARDNVMAFDFGDGRFLDSVVHLPRLNGQAIVFFPQLADQIR
jgi:hypothetical protein